MLFSGIILFILPFTYNLAGNYIYFQSHSPMIADNLFVREFYISLFVKGRSPFHALRQDVFPVEVQNLYNEYSDDPKNLQERREMAQKYLKEGILEVKKVPGGFIFSRFAKFFYVWEKHFIYYYYQPANKFLDPIIYWSNI